MKQEDYKKIITNTPDFPKPGIQFKDMMPVLYEPDTFAEVINDLNNPVVYKECQTIVGLESRGFILGAAFAAMWGYGFVPCRKKGKLPPPVVQEKYSLEYGEDIMEMAPAKVKGEPVVIMDDLLATGGTAIAVINLCRKAGYEVKQVNVFIELKDLGAREKIEAMGVKVNSLVQY